MNKKLRVLILDEDNKGLKQMVQWLKETRKVDRVLVFSDYVELIEEASKSPPDYCFLRLGVAGLPGLAAAYMLKEMGDEIKIVFISEDRNYALDAFEIGVYGFLLYPVERKKLEAVFQGKNDLAKMVDAEI